MNRTKFSIWMSVAFIAVLLLSAGCGVGNDPKKAGEKAAKEACKCFDKKITEIQECAEKIDKKYKKFEDDKDFQEIFLKTLQNDCKAYQNILNMYDFF